jgi:uncharacterized MAPEG superfamily protein
MPPFPLPPLTAAITLGALTLLFVIGALVARARGQYGVKAPATTGHPMFERHYRVQMNTLENAVIFLPALWLCAFSTGDRWAAALGAVWLVGRIWYGFAYVADPRRRSGGFGLATLAWAGLMVGSALAVGRAVLSG